MEKLESKRPNTATPVTTKGSIAGHRLEPGTAPLLLTLALGVFAGALDLSVLSPALPAITGEFGVGASSASLAITIYLLANIAAIPVAGKLADRHGRRPAYIVCVAIFAIGSLVTIMAQSYTMFLIGRAIQAAGAGGIFPVATAAIADRVPPERRGGALGILGAIWGLAGILGPIIGGIFTSAISWRWIFILNLPLSVFVILMALKHMPQFAPGKRGPLDISGIVLLTTGLIATMVALTHLDPTFTNFGGPIAGIIAAVIAIAAFVALRFVEPRAAEPVISPALVGKREIAVTYFLEILIGAIEGSLFFVPAALHAGQNLNAASAGLIASLGAFLFVGVIPIAGRALDKIGARAVLGIGSLAAAVGLVIFAVGYHSLVLSLISMIISGAGFGALLGAPTRYIITQEAPAENRSTAIGLLSIFLIMGQLVGASLAGGLIGRDALVAGHFQMVYLAFAALGIIAFFVTRLLSPPRPVSAAT